MKNNFIEVTHGNEKVLINLLNVAKVTPSKDRTLIIFNFSKKEDVYMVTADEPYQTIKKMIDAQQ
jgi:hypothetical protein